MTKIKLIFAALFIQVTAFAQISQDVLIGTLQSKAPTYQLTVDDYTHFKVLSQYQDKATGVQHIYVRQTINGIELFDGNTDLHYDRNGKLIVMHNKFQADAKSRINSANASITPADALQRFAATVGKSVAGGLSKTSNPLNNNTYTLNDANLSPEPVNVTLYYLTQGESIILVWNVELYDLTTSDWWNARMDAQTGELIEKNNWTVSCHPTSGAELRMQDESPLVKAEPAQEVYGKAGTGSYNVVPMPLESYGFGPRALVEGTPTNNGSPFGWHDTDGVAGADYTITRGNNVYATADTANKNIPGYAPDGGSSLLFDYDYSPRNSPGANVPAAITNLFYWNNLNHDIFYNYGFDENSGNYQANNYTKGGLEHDAVFADAQDGSGTNNANFSAPIDGKPGRMQMYLWTRQNAGAYGLHVLNGQYAGNYNAPPSLFGPKILSNMSAELALVLDGSTTYTGCNTITNDLTGKIALVYRGTGSCAIPQKVINAQNAGAIAVIVVTGSFPSSLSGTDIGVNVPSVALARTTGDNLKNRLLAGDTINVTLIGDSNANVMYDSDLDNGVITHEYGHGISIRLSGGPSNSSCLTNAEQGGEGWSDFFALCLTAKASDTSLSGRGIGTWVYDQSTTGVGIRTYKYGRSTAINPMTYNSIKSMNEVHYVGSVWCTMLYDAYLDMVRKYGFNPNFYENTVGGNNMMMQLVIDAMKLQPCNPGFIDMRDAILLADSLRNGNANRSLLWKAFAKRGLGLSADQGLSTSVSDGSEAYDLPVFSGLLNERAWDRLAIYPNPSTTAVNIALPDQLLGAQIELFDLAGKMVYNQFEQAEDSKVLLQTNSFEKGIYLLRVSSGDHSFQTKLVVE